MDEGGCFDLIAVDGSFGRERERECRRLTVSFARRVRIGMRKDDDCYSRPVISLFRVFDDGWLVRNVLGHPRMEGLLSLLRKHAR